MEDPTILDRVYAVLHQMEKEQQKRRHREEGDDWLDGVRTGQGAARRELVARLHWILDPDTIAADMTDAGPLVARLNERLIDGRPGPGDEGYKDGYADGGSPKPGPEYPGGPTGGPPSYPGFGPNKTPPPKRKPKA